MLHRRPGSPLLALAPMAGVTDGDFRVFIRRLGGCDLVFTEFISAEGLLRGNPSTLKMLHFAEEERPIAVQIYGADPERMAEAARLVEATGADVCDLNMGCPAKNVLKGGAGAALTGNLPLARAIVQRVRAAISIPLTVKYRLGLREDAMTYLELGRILEGEGVDAVTLHPRTASQHLSGRADWRHIAQLKAVLTIPVIGNGDVRRAEDVLAMREATGCDGVMIGRATLTNPWIFREAAAALAGRSPSPPTMAERRDFLLQHFREILQREEGRTALHKLKTLTAWYSHGVAEGRQLRRRLNDLPSPAAVLAAVEEFFAQRPVASLPGASAPPMLPHGERSA